jgi:hypothetical protein
MKRYPWSKSWTREVGALEAKIQVLPSWAIGIDWVEQRSSRLFQDEKFNVLF